MSEVKRYRFYTIFTIDPIILKPLFNVKINGVFYQKGTPLQVGVTFGGLNLYNYVGRAVAGIWDNDSKTLEIVGFYK